MLSEQTRAVIKQTIPILREHGEALTRHFYQRLFTAVPAAKSFFNPAHQTAGTQQRALAGAVLAFAENIDNPAALAPAIDRIGHKHVSLNVTPELYPIVGEHLLGSIQDLLGEAATPQILKAWGEAYEFLAGVCIAREREFYQRQQETAGWTGFRKFRIQKSVQECDTIRSLYLSPVDGQALRAFEPGQFVTVRINTPDGTTIRNYSLSYGPTPEFLRISVKRVNGVKAGDPDGVVSNWLHSAALGTQIEVGPPCGDFTLSTAGGQTNRPLVLIAGGIGVTPLLPMATAALKANPDRQVRFIQCVQNGESHAFRRELDRLATRHASLELLTRYSAPCPGDEASGRCGSVGWFGKDMLSDDPTWRDAEYYFCGPPAFMGTVQNTLDQMGVAADRRHFEFFGPPEDLSKFMPERATTAAGELQRA